MIAIKLEEEEQWVADARDGLTVNQRKNEGAVVIRADVQVTSLLSRTGTEVSAWILATRRRPWEKNGKGKGDSH
jgi:hypothetical protein